MIQKIDELNNIINDKHKEIELLNELKEQAEGKADEEYHIRLQAESKVKEEELKNQNNKKIISRTTSANRRFQIEKMKVQDLRKDLGINASEPYIKLAVLKSMLLKKEGLDSNLLTPPGTPHSIRSIDEETI